MILLSMIDFRMQVKLSAKMDVEIRLSGLTIINPLALSITRSPVGYTNAPTVWTKSSIKQVNGNCRKSLATVTRILYIPILNVLVLKLVEVHDSLRIMVMLLSAPSSWPLITFIN